MTEAQAFFFQVLSDHIHRRMTAAVPAGLDQEALYQMVKKQSLAGIFYVQCRDAADSSLLERLHTVFLSSVFRAVNRRAELAELAEAYKAAGIPFLTMKGFTFCTYYPVPELRTMGDVDLIIHPQDRQRCDTLMTTLGFEKYIDHPSVWTYQRDITHYEIHDHMFYEPLANELDYIGYFDHVWEHVTSEDGRLVIQPDYHFLYLMAHTAKHIINLGSGVRPFLDMIFLTRANPGMDWDWIQAELKKLRLLDFTKTCFALCERWFGVKMPLATPPLSDAFFDSTTAKIFADGLWGHDNDENRVSATAKYAKRSRKSYAGSAICMTLSKLFPPYAHMRLVPWYAFVDGRPWLLPAAWLYRFYYCARHKGAHSRESLAQPFVERDAIHRREAMIESWGL